MARTKPLERELARNPYREEAGDKEDALEEAIELWQERFAADPKSATAWATLYSYLQQAERFEQAREVARSADEAGHRDAFTRLVTDHTLELDDREARRAARSRDPQEVFFAARGRMLKGRPEGAAELQLRALELERGPRTVDTWGVLKNQLSLIARGRVKRARELEQALREWLTEFDDGEFAEVTEVGEVRLRAEDLELRRKLIAELLVLDLQSVPTALLRALARAIETTSQQRVANKIGDAVTSLESEERGRAAELVYDHAPQLYELYGGLLPPVSDVRPTRTSAGRATDATNTVGVLVVIAFLGVMLIWLMSG